MGWGISYTNEWEDYSNYFGEGVGFPEIGPPPAFWLFMVSLGTVLLLVDVSFSMLMYYSEGIMRLNV